MTWGFAEQDRLNRALLRWNDLEFYVQDSFKASSNMTLDLGIRASYFPHPYQDDALATSFDPASFDPALGNDPCNGMLQVPGTDPCGEAGYLGGTDAPSKSLLKGAKIRFAPRVGLAWDISGTGKTALRAGAGIFYLRERVSPSLSLPNNPPFATQLEGLRKLDTNTEPCGGCFGNTFPRPGFGRALDDHIPTNYQWNLSLEHEILPNTILEVGYVGNKGKNLLISQDINQVPSADNDGNGVSDRLDYVRLAQAGNEAGAAAGAYRRFGVWADRRIVYFDHSGDSIYHSLQTQLLRRFGNGSQLQASYTFSRTISNDPLDNSNGNIDAEVAVTDLENPGLDRSLSRTHRAHSFNASLIWNLPSFEGKSSFTKNVLGDWQIGTIVQAMSGTPITVYTRGLTIAGGGTLREISGTGYPDNLRPNVTGDTCDGSGDKEQILNPGAFTLNGFQLGTIGSAGRRICEGPGLFQVDLALYKNIRLSNRLKAQLRLDIFNVFDTVNFLSASVNQVYDPTVTLDAPLANATTITSAALSPTSQFGRASSARDPRQMQFALRFIF
jgi:hypothetical protein